MESIMNFADFLRSEPVFCAFLAAAVISCVAGLYLLFREPILPIKGTKWFFLIMVLIGLCLLYYIYQGYGVYLTFHTKPIINQP